MPIMADRTNRLSDARLFEIARIGVWPNYYPNVAFSRDPAALEQLFQQVIPNVTDDPEVISDALAALFKKIGPAILVTHSQSSTFGWLAARKSENVKAIVSYEVGGVTFPEGEAPTSPGGSARAPVTIPLTEFMKLTRIPIQMVYGDNIPTSPSPVPLQDTWRLNLANSKAFAAALNRHGGDAAVLHLPDIGLKGNTHFPMSDLNNVEVADQLSKFLKAKGLDKREPS